MIWAQVATYLPPYWRMMLRRCVPHEVQPVPRRSEAYIQGFCRPSKAARSVVMRMVAQKYADAVNDADPGIFPSDGDCALHTFEFLEGAMDRPDLVPEVAQVLRIMREPVVVEDNLRVAWLHAFFATDDLSRQSAYAHVCGQLAAYAGRLRKVLP